ncbi:uncharacterized protein LOC125652595 isoform X3 [Ostrea edulis]|uniref:uncharacterized protein LOC125652595 isoform X3 n=1 Tax=Ostrea edulis TaxID=37623 RepID=UPI0024AF3BFB|nr:uncharacterized protein LOC125652595 isoform X3 [Ostrea edulis]
MCDSYLFCLQILLYECPGNPNKYIKRGNKYCQKIYNCPRGHQIITCVENCTKELCQSCPDGYVQPFQIQSVTTPSIDRKCFKPKGDCQEGQIPVRNGNATIGCPKAAICQCDPYKCWYGSNPCICNRFDDKCPKDEYLFLDGSSPSCKKCPEGSRKNNTGCGPCEIIYPYAPPNPSPVEPITTFDISTGISEISTFKTTTPAGPVMEANVLILSISSAGVLVFIIIIIVVMVICKKYISKQRTDRHIRRANSDEEQAGEFSGEVVAENRTPLARPLIMPESTEDVLSRQTPKSPVVSETEQPGIFHPNDPKALRQGNFSGPGLSLDDDSYMSTYNDSSETATNILDQPCNTEAPFLDTMRKTEGIHTDYLINKLDDENCELKQPIQCEEDSLRSETFQKYTHSDITQQKELFEGVFQSLTDEKVLCVSQVSDTTDPKHYVDSLN